MDNPSPLYVKLLGETAKIGWVELERYFASGSLLLVAGHKDLVEMAEAIADNRQDKVVEWLSAGELNKVTEAQAQDFIARDPDLWAVVVAPWILVQERSA